MAAKTPTKRGRYGAGSELVDYILGITFEIWEERGVELIHQYYAPDCVVHGLDAVQQGAQAMVESTRTYLNPFLDRLLLADEVIWSNDLEHGFYSSHRIQSPMTNLGASAFGPATGKPVRVTAIADCVVKNGRITQEWLVRDGLALVRQLGFDALPAAWRIAESRVPDLAHTAREAAGKRWWTPCPTALTARRTAAWAGSPGPRLDATMPCRNAPGSQSVTGSQRRCRPPHHRVSLDRPGPQGRRTSAWTRSRFASLGARGSCPDDLLDLGQLLLRRRRARGLRARRRAP